MSMCWQRGHFKSVAVSVHKIRIAFQRRHFCNPDRLAAVRAVDGEKPFPLFNGFDHGLRLRARRSGHAAAPPKAAMNARRLTAIPPEEVNSALASDHVAAGAAGFFALIQSGDRPEQ